MDNKKTNSLIGGDGKEEEEPFGGQLGAAVEDVKATEDCTKEVDLLLPKATEDIKAGRVAEAIEGVMALEKKARQGGDGRSCSRLCCFVLEIYKERKDWKQIEEQLPFMCKRRGQLKRTIIDMVRLVNNWIMGDDLKENKVEQLRLITTVTTVTEGKIFVEVERAKIIRFWAHLREAEGKIDEAATLLQEVQVETFGGMERIEKTEYVLDQMRLVLLRNDFIRCQIISKKLNPKLLEQEEFQKQKLEYYDYLLRYHLNEGLSLSICRDYYAQLHTPMVLADSSRWQPLLQRYALYLILAPFDSEQNDLLVKLKETEKKRLAEMPFLKTLVDDFLRKELLPWPLPYDEELRQHSVFCDTPHPGGEERWERFRKRVVQHNIRVCSFYYQRVRLDRMAELLGVTRKEVEAEILELVNSRFLVARMNRPAGTVRFAVSRESAAELSDWTADVDKLLNLLDESSHLIQKERMVNAAKAKRTQLELRSAAA